MQQLKQKRKDLVKEKKGARIVVVQRRVDERIERDKARQVKDQQKQMARQEKEKRKAQQMLEKEQGMINMVDNDTRIANETRIISNSLDSIADNTPLFQDLINIQVPHYTTEGLPTCLIPTRVGANSMYAHYTPPLNAGTSSANVRYGYSIPPWLEAANWSQSYGSIQPFPNQPLIGRPTYLAQEGNSRSFGTQDSQGHKE